MKSQALLCLALVLACAWPARAEIEAVGSTTILTASGKNWQINGQTVQLWGVRAANGFWDDPTDANDDIYRTVDKLIAALPQLKAHGVIAVSVNLQGGRTANSGSEPEYHRQFNGFNADGTLKQDAKDKLTKLLTALDKYGMVLNLGLFYVGQDQTLSNDAAVNNAITQVAQWLKDGGWRNVFMDIANECGEADADQYNGYNRTVLSNFSGCASLCPTFTATNSTVLCGTSSSVGAVTANAITIEHNTVCANGLSEPCVVNEMLRRDAYDAGGAGEFDAGEITTTLSEIDTSKARNVGYFAHSTWMQMVYLADGSNSTVGALVGPRFHFGGNGTDGNEGVHWIYDRMANCNDDGNCSNTQPTAPERTFALSWGTGTDAAGCGAPANPPCKSVKGVLDNVDLGGGDFVYATEGTYRQTSEVLFTSADAGASLGNPVTWTCPSRGCLLTGLSTTLGSTRTWLPCGSGAPCGSAYPNTYYTDITGVPTFKGVTETNWLPFVANDQPGGGTDAAWTFHKPLNYSSRSISQVATTEGSYAVSGNFLIVRPFWTGRTPSVSGVEMISTDNVVNASTSGASFQTFDGFDFGYSAGTASLSAAIMLRNVDGWTIKNANIWSPMGWWVRDSGDHHSIIDSTCSSAYVRGTMEDQDSDGIIDRGEGWFTSVGSNTCLKIDGSSNALIDGVVASNSWNVVSVEKFTNLTIRDSVIKNSPNHTLIVALNGSGTCTGALFENVAAFNGQDSYFIRGCSNGIIRHGLGRFQFLDDVGGGHDSPGWDIRSSIIWKLAVQSASTSNWDARYNAYINTGECDYANVGGGEGECDATWPGICSCESGQYIGRANYQLSGVNVTGSMVGLQYAELDLDDFAPVAGSPLFDKGDPDLDHDGTPGERSLCVGGTRDGKQCEPAAPGLCAAGGGTCPSGDDDCPGGDDCCTAARGCYGEAPDIGPRELGLVSGAPVCGNGDLENGEDCDDGNATSGDCCSSLCLWEATGAACGSGLDCTSAGTCSAGHVCTGGTPVTCNDNFSCTTNSCVEIPGAGGGCVYTANHAACLDSTYCDGIEVCLLSGGAAITGCAEGTPINCNDSCGTTTDTCNEATDSCDHSGTSCTGGGTACTNGVDEGDAADTKDFVDNLDLGCLLSGGVSEAPYTGSTTWTIPCTAPTQQLGDLFMQAIQDANSIGGGTAGAPLTIKFACTGPTVVTINTTTWANSDRELGYSIQYVVIDGENRLEFLPTVRWPTLSVCGGLACDSPAGGLPERCPDSSETTPRFFTFRGKFNTMKRLKFSEWMDGTRFDTADSPNFSDTNLIEDVVCYLPGDSCFSGDPASGAQLFGRRNILRRTECQYSCDKCYQLYGRDGVSTNELWASTIDAQGFATDYDTAVFDSKCTNSAVCIRANNDGYILINGLTVTEQNPTVSQFSCSEGIFADDASGCTNCAPFIRATNVNVSNCEDGILALDDTRLILSDSSFTGIDTSSVRIENTAQVSVYNSTISGSAGIRIMPTFTGAVDFGGGTPITYPLYLAVNTAGTSNNFAAATCGITNDDSTPTTVTAKCGVWDDADPSNEICEASGTDGRAVIVYDPVFAQCVAPQTTGKTLTGGKLTGGKIQ